MKSMERITAKLPPLIVLACLWLLAACESKSELNNLRACSADGVTCPSGTRCMVTMNGTYTCVDISIGVDAMMADVDASFFADANPMRDGTIVTDTGVSDAVLRVDFELPDSAASPNSPDMNVAFLDAHVEDSTMDAVRVDAEIVDPIRPDAAIVDAHVTDAVVVDAEVLDSAIMDARLPDAVVVDAAMVDAHLLDAVVVVDAAIVDAVLPDAAIVDVLLPDALIVDALLPDAASVDAHVTDAMVFDAEVLDAAIIDARFPDAVVVDAAMVDAHLLDAGVVVDAAIVDAVLPDAAIVDVLLPDALIVDALLPDAASVDAHVTDAMVFDAEVLDAAIIDARFPDAVVVDAAIVDVLSPDPLIINAMLPDATNVDTHLSDAVVVDAEVLDAAIMDARFPGAVVVDAAIVDAHLLDAVLVDAAIVDAHLLDAMLPDVAIVDVMLPDALIVDAMVVDAEVMDAAIIDARLPDAVVVDAAIVDAHLSDAVVMDAAIVDAPIIDARFPDAVVVDAAIVDAMLPDAAIVDAHLPDAVVVDAAIVDAMLPDAASVDALLPDAVVVDAEVVDAAIIDAGFPDAVVVDAAIVDAMLNDVAIVDAMLVDAAIVDAMLHDVAIVDAMLPDALIVDAASENAMSVDAAHVDAMSADAAVVADSDLPSCTDRVQNGDETDVDCGGVCPSCPSGRFCTEGSDCVSGVCANDECQAPRCGDGIQNGTEACDDGNVVTELCAYRVESCTVCSADCSLEPGLLEPCRETDPVCQPKPFGQTPTLDFLEYAFWYWPSNHRPGLRRGPYNRSMHFLTGHYGMAFNEETAQLSNLGFFEDQLSMSQASDRSNDHIFAFAGADLRFEAGDVADPSYITGFYSPEGFHQDHAQLRDSGRFMNYIEFPNVTYANGDSDLIGRVEIASMPRHFVLNHTVNDATARIRLGGEFLAGLTAEWLVENRALRLVDADSRGWLFVVHGTTTLSIDGDVVVAEHFGNPNQAHTVSLLVAPTVALTDAERSLYLDPDATVDVTYQLLDAQGAAVGERSTVQWDPIMGVFRVDLQGLNAAGLTGDKDYDTRPELHNLYGRHEIGVDTHGQTVSVPMAFFGNGQASLYITGGVASLRDLSGEPVGVPVQISKNWHDQSLGAWYHFYTQPVFSGDTSHALELTIASSRWGRDAYAASHAQLSLIGYNNAGGHWDESALGAFGESITYDPDVTLTRAMVDDVRPFLVQAQNKWSWTGNVGGADFLRYTAAEQPNTIRRLGRVRSTYFDAGPNLTNVKYSGVTSDGKISADIGVQMGRTDDVVRTYFHLKYTFNEDVAYDRLAFFQMAADRYGDNGFAHVAWGDADGVLDGRLIPDHGTTGYADEADRGIPLTGDAPWVMLYDNQKTEEALPEHFADLVYVVRAFEAQIGDELIDTPHLNLHRTTNRDSQYGLELGLPYTPGEIIPAGSTVHATVEYLVPPADKSVYYGSSDWLEDLPARDWQTPTMAQRMAQGNQLDVVMSVGTLERTYPVEVETVTESVAARFTLSGGLGYVPITFHGLTRYDGWQLQVAAGSVWIPVEQSVHGNDYWQTRWDETSDTYSITYTVPNLGAHEYRLIWRGHAQRPEAPYAAEKELVQRIGINMKSPNLWVDDVSETPAQVEPGETKAVYLDGPNYEGSPTRMYAWFGVPQGASAESPVPGIVLVHGGGGTAYRQWVNRWTARGYAAIAIAVEGQTDTPATEADAAGGQAVGGWRRHAMSGPARVGAYGDADRPIEAQWMYHATAGTALAGVYLRERPEIDANAVGVMGISWGGVIAATVVGVDDRFAFGIPVYGNGHKYDIPNYFGNALRDHRLYREVWDPYLRMDRVQTPMLWLSFPQENNFSLDSQAATYLAAPGPRTVSLVPNMGHGHGPGWSRPESYVFADAVISSGAPWAEQGLVQEMDGTATVVFSTMQSFERATLVYTTESGYTGELNWTEIPVDGFEYDDDQGWTATVNLPAQTTGWFINAYATHPLGALVVSSDYQERIALQAIPNAGVVLQHPIGVDRSSSRFMLGYTGPSYVEVVSADVIESSIDGSCAATDMLPLVLTSPLPNTTPLRFEFDNARAQLELGETATCIFRVEWAALDGSTFGTEFSAEIVVVDNQPFEIDADTDWSDAGIYVGADVSIVGGASVTLDAVADVKSLNLANGTLTLNPGSSLRVTETLSVGASGSIIVNGGRLELLNEATQIDGVVRLTEGEVYKNMFGVDGQLRGTGRIEVLGGHLNFSGGQPVNILIVDVDLFINAGEMTLSGQIYVGQTRDAVFEIVGSLPEISISRFNTAGGRRGIYRFVLDANGVSPITVPGWMNFGFGTVEVDGTDYLGASSSFPLLNSNNLVALTDAENLSIEGFEDTVYAAEIVQDEAAGRNWILLTIEMLP